MDKSHLLGIDVGTATVKVFSGAMTNEQDISIDSIGIMQTFGFDKGAISDYKALSSSIKQAVDCAISDNQVSAQGVYIGVGGMGIRSFNCIGSIAPHSPKTITNEDIDRVCRSSVLTGIPEELYVLHILPLCFWVDKKRQTSAPIGMQGSCLEVETLVVAAPEMAIKELIAAVRNTGIKVAGVVANSIVGAQALAPDTKDKKVIIIDIGAGTTDVSLYRGGVIYNSASLPLGGNYITRDIMKALEISEQHAEGIKRYYSRLDKAFRGQAVILDCNDYGTTDKQVSYDFLFDVIESRVEEIVYLIHEHIKGSMLDSDINEIVFTGGCSAMPSFVAAIEKHFGLQVKTKVPDKLLAEYSYPSNTSCYGVILHAARHAAAVSQEPTTQSWRSLFEKIRKFF
ncbi:MAG: cell division protein FtsA [Veillonellaceae bacterium]|jgi:cell division protein FtsA|nr:cell division protein FtsA [Veillonellaceae bacterium]